MIISVSRRTDIPRFFVPWFMNRIRDGYCLVPNPVYPKQGSRVSLKLKDVTAIVFWTRFPEALLPFLEELDSRRYKYYFQYTITGYGKTYEKNAPSPESTIECFIKLSEHVGPERVIWRYDPIFFTADMDEAFHLSNFESISSKLQGKCEKIVISLLDEYSKTIAAFRKEGIAYSGNPLQRESLPDFLKQLVLIAGDNNMSIETCAELADYGDIGINRGHCIDEKLISKLVNQPLKYKKDPSQRQACGCMVSRDIGVNNTCLGRCIYCYATQQASIGKAVHDKDFPALIKIPKIVQHVEENSGDPEQLDLF